MHLFLMHVYSQKFPGLDTLIATPVEFSKCILRIGHKRVRSLVGNFLLEYFGFGVFGFFVESLDCGD